MAEEIVPQIFNSPEFGQLRIIKDADDEPWFVATDVAKVLGYRDAEKLTRNLDTDERDTQILGTSGGQQVFTVVSESGFYHAVMARRSTWVKDSDKRQFVVAFQRWVTHEVLPSIRRDGGYMVAKADETPEEVMARALVIAQQTIERSNRRIEELKAVNDELRPKALFADAVGASDGTCLVGELAKMLKQNGLEIGQNRLFQRLRSEGYLGKSGNNYNVPTQRAMELGLFRIKETTIVHSDGHTTVQRTPKVTGNGQVNFINRYCDSDTDEH